jgi:hypothetical protein
MDFSFMLCALSLLDLHCGLKRKRREFTAETSRTAGVAAVYGAEKNPKHFGLFFTAPMMLLTLIIQSHLL